MSGRLTRNIPSLEPTIRGYGLLSVFVGIGVLAIYPLAVLDLVAAGQTLSGGVPEATFPPVVYLSVVAGSVLGTWGAFVARERSLTPLTTRRAFLAPLLGGLATVAGIATFAARWLRGTPTNLEGQPYELPMLEIVRLEFTGVQLIALAGVSAIVVGTTLARRGRRAAAVIAVLPVALTALAHSDRLLFDPNPMLTVPVLVALSIVPFLVGYVGADTE